MNKTSFITYSQVEEYAIKHYQRYGTMTPFKTVVQYLFEHHACHTGEPDLPKNIIWSSLSDEDFCSILNNLPIRNIFTPSDDFNSMDPAIAAESIMPEALDAYALKYVRNIVEKMHTHNFFEVNYVFSGQCNMIFENEKRLLKTGELCIIAPHSRHDVTVSDDSVVMSLMLRQNTFDTTFFQLLAQEDLLASFFRNILYSQKETANYILFITDNSAEVKSAIKDIVMESHVRDTYSNTCIISRIHLFFSLLLRRYSDSIQFYENQKNIGEHTSFTRILQYIQNHYQTLTLSSLAHVFHYNSSYLSRMIKKNTGQTLIEILTKLKISRASDLLLQTDLKIDDIAKAVGYDCTDHFSRQFKHVYGMAPRDYRHSNIHLPAFSTSVLPSGSRSSASA